MEDHKMIFGNRLYVPDTIQAILWDMDGVLLDTLSLDLRLCETLVQKYMGVTAHLSREFIRSIFAYHPPEFWRRILTFAGKEHGIKEPERHLDTILSVYNRIRKNEAFDSNPGIVEILEDLSLKGFKTAVVSNNPTEDVKKILKTSGIDQYFHEIIGNDIRDLKKKPAPDTYLLAAECLEVEPKKCAVVEDSLLGAEAGHKAGCFTIGVATGSAELQDLERSPWIHQVYSEFFCNHLMLAFGQVTRKRISTPNDFVSHMIEHIAWRLGCEIELEWNNTDWHLLGIHLGRQIGEFTAHADKSAALGMIDDGSAEVFIDRKSPPRLALTSVTANDLQWFLSLRCEQLSNGAPLKNLLEGLAAGLDAEIEIRLCSVEDPHHSWEGVFRSVGIALSRIYTPMPDNQNGLPTIVEENVSKGNVSVEARSAQYARISRHTAESVVTVGVDFSRKMANNCRIQSPFGISLDPFCKLLLDMATQAGFSIQLDFDTTALASSHVVVEDTGLVLGRALKEILVQRMLSVGATGSGDSFEQPEDFDNQPVRVGISVEGRKFWRLMPFDETYGDLKKRFIIGQTVLDSIYSEDLDDFLDGLSGGMDASIMIHLKERIAPDTGWQLIFKNLGKALRGVFEMNPYRKGVPPGVKATLE